MRITLALSLAALSFTLVAYVDPTTGNPHATQVLVPADIPARNWERGHRGVDLALAPGADVLAAGSGEVAFAGVVAGTPVVSLVHPDGIRTTYQPVHARVAKGDAVMEGQVIGTLTGTAGLHWGALSGPDTYLNPLLLLDQPTIRLKPVDGPGYRSP